MPRSVRKIALDALTLLLALAMAVAAGDNANARFNLASDEVVQVGLTDTVNLQIEASGLAAVKAMEISLSVSPSSAFDLAATAYEMPTSWIVADSSAVANLFFTAALITTPAFDGETDATITVDRIAIGPPGSAQDVFNRDDLAITVAVNPTVTAVLESTQQPTATALAQNYPNPFNPVTSIRFELGSRASVTLTVYNPAGQAVRSLVAGEFLQAGTYSLTWDGRDDAGHAVASGVYLYRLQAGSQVRVRKLVLVR